MYGSFDSYGDDDGGVLFVLFVQVLVVGWRIL